MPGTTVFEAALRYNERLNFSTDVQAVDTSKGVVNGNSLDFTKHTYVLSVGNVGNGTTAEVAAAFQAAYTPSGKAGTSGATQLDSHPGENLIIIGQVNNGNTVVYDWVNWRADGQGVYLPTGAANTLVQAETLVGASTAALTAHDFF